MVKGHIEGKRRLRRILCGFEQDTFDLLVKRAEGDGVSVSEVIRTYVEWGMEDEQREMERFRKIANETGFEFKVNHIDRE